MARTTLYNEKYLLRKISAGCETSFRRLFDFYQPTIYTAALRMTGDRSLSEDILQDTFLKVWLNRTSLPDLANFSGWLYTVARNLMFDTLRSSTRHKIIYGAVYDDVAAPLPMSTEHAMHDKALQAILQEAIDRLPLKQHQTYTLIKSQGMTREKAAHILQVSPETVKSNLERAMRSIRAYCISKLETAVILPLLYFSHFYTQPIIFF